MKPLWQSPPYTVKSSPFTLGDGVNNGLPPFKIKDSELTDALNIDSKRYPSLRVRDGRTADWVSDTTVPKMLSQRNNETLMTVDNSVWKSFVGPGWSSLAIGLAQVGAKTEDFVTGTSRFTILSNGTDRLSWDGTTVTTLTAMPLTKLFTVHKGRVYALIDNVIKYCALNVITDWSSAGNAGAGSIVITNVKGPSRAIATYRDHVVAWTESSMHELYGTGPKNYTLVDVSMEIGCLSDWTVKEVKGRLFWLGSGHVYEYVGNLPRIVSHKVQGYIDRINRVGALSTVQPGAVAGTDGRRYYLAIPVDNSNVNNIVLVYDTELEIWHVESGNIIDFVEFDGGLFGITSTGKIINMAEGTTDDGTAIAWHAITKPFNENNLGDKKSWHRLFFIVDLPIGSTLNIGLSESAEGGNFTLVQSITANADIQNQQIEIPLTIAQKVDWVRLKFWGTGPCEIHDLEKKIRVVKR